MKPIKKLEYQDGYDCVRREVFIGTDRHLPLDGVEKAEKAGKGEWKEVEMPRTEVIDDMLDKIEELVDRVNELSKGHSCGE